MTGLGLTGEDYDDDGEQNPPTPPRPGPPAPLDDAPADDVDTDDRGGQG